jgi:pimeloyl-ACP methyl ester carboxylesterase
MSEVIADVRRRARRAPVWLVGTSSGTLSAVGVAAHLPISATAEVNDKRPNGIVLTSTQTDYVHRPDLTCGKTVFDAALAAINVPALVVSHRDDPCPCSPASGADRVLAALTALGAAKKQARIFAGGGPARTKKLCEAMTPHGFIGIEDGVVAAIADWIKTH